MGSGSAGSPNLSFPSPPSCSLTVGPHPRRERGIINPSNDEAHKVTYRRRQRLQSPSILLRSQEAGVCPTPFLKLKQSGWGCSGRIFIPVSRSPCSRSPSPDAVHGQRRESEERTHETTQRKEWGATPSKAIKEVGLFH